MAVDLSAHHETTDGSRPAARHFPEPLALKWPLAAMAVVKQGDAFDARRAPPKDGPARAARWFDATVQVHLHGAGDDVGTRIRNDAIRLLGHATAVVNRLEQARTLRVDVVPKGASFRKLGFPARSLEGAAGLFWDEPTWQEGRIALRVEHLATLPALVAHELAHFVHCVAFTEKERAAIDALLRPTFGSRANMDEAFAIYSEQEFLLADRFAVAGGALPTTTAPSSRFSADDKRGPGVYGFTRSQWDDNHVFTRFARKLYHPHAPLAGQATTGRADRWRSFMG